MSAATPNDGDRAQAINVFGLTHGADLKHVEQAFADARAEAREALREAIVEGNGTHDCPACRPAGSGTLLDGRDCPLCEGWGHL